MKIDLQGKNFERLDVVRASSVRNGKQFWLCKCNCDGPMSLLEVSTAKLRNGHTRSCGCLQKYAASRIGSMTGKINGRLKKTHGKNSYNSATYRCWSAMRARCNNPNRHNYVWYGGRGIKVCDRWSSFENFLADMGERPHGATLDRYPDNDGNYEPGNCRWATMKEQCGNRRARRS